MNCNSFAMGRRAEGIGGEKARKLGVRPLLPIPDITSVVPLVVDRGSARALSEDACIKSGNLPIENMFRFFAHRLRPGASFICVEAAKAAQNEATRLFVRWTLPSVCWQRSGEM